MDTTQLQMFRHSRHISMCMIRLLIAGIHRALTIYGGLSDTTISGTMLVHLAAERPKHFHSRLNH